LLQEITSITNRKAINGIIKTANMLKKGKKKAGLGTVKATKNDVQGGEKKPEATS
jgi:hypothetical protein